MGRGSLSQRHNSIPWVANLTSWSSEGEHHGKRNNLTEAEQHPLDCQSNLVCLCCWQASLSWCCKTKKSMVSRKPWTIAEALEDIKESALLLKSMVDQTKAVRSALAMCNVCHEISSGVCTVFHEVPSHVQCLSWSVIMCIGFSLVGVPLDV